MDKSQTKSSIKVARNSLQTSIPWSYTVRRTASAKQYGRENNSRPQEVKLHTEERAVKRAMFNYEVATKLYIIELQKKQRDRLQKMIEEEEIRLLRKEMIPRAQLMPYFDRPFYPQSRSSRPLTIPREPSFIVTSKCWNRTSSYNLYGSHHAQPLKPIK